MRLGGNVPGGLIYNRLPVVWLAQHPDGPVLTIERLGPTVALVWRPYAYYRAPFYEAAVFGGSVDYESNLAEAEAMAEVFMGGPAPEHILPRNVKADQRERAREREDESAAATLRGPGGRRRRKTDEEIRVGQAARQKRYRDSKAERDAASLAQAQQSQSAPGDEIAERNARRVKARPYAEALGKFTADALDSWCNGGDAPNVSTWFSLWCITAEGRAAMTAA